MNKRLKVSKLKGREETKAYLFLMPSLLGVSLFVLIPFCDVIRRSFLDAMGNNYVGIQNYATIFQNEAFLLAGKNTIRFILICIPLLLILSLVLALLLYRKTPLKDFFKTTFLLPMAIPVASVVLLWKLMFHKNGLLNVFLLGLGVGAVDWMNTKYAFGVLVFSYLWKNIGYDMILWLAGLSSISGSLYEAASLDGAGRVQMFRYITLPLLRPTVFMIGVLSLVNSFKVFREAYLVAGNYPHKSIYMIQHLFNNWFVNLEIHKMCAAAVLFVAVILLFVWGIGKVTKKKGEENEY